MDFYKIFYHNIYKIVMELASKKGVSIPSNHAFVVESPKHANHGDISTNVAMSLSKVFSMKPLDLAEDIKIEILKLPNIKSVEILNPGFINIIVRNEFWHERLKSLLEIKEQFGRKDEGNGIKVNIEYVSANPTGPLHVGHGRGAVVGDVLSNIYKYFGFEVTKEYYINDAGNQMDVLADSLYYRYSEILGKLDDFIKPEEFYPGEYLIDVAQELVDKDGEKWLQTSFDERRQFLRDYSIDKMMSLIKQDLKLIDINHDIFSSERRIATDIRYKAIIEDLTKRDLVYIGKLNPPKGKVIEDFEPREQKLLRSTNYGDDSDRPLEKSNGERTYFANDLVYHADKIQRGFSKLVNIWGSDHVGYIKRVSVAVDALSYSSVQFDVVCCQLVNLLENGNHIKMSKRAGNFITLADLVEEIGKDIFRFMMITRKNDMSLDLDLALVKEQSSNNPVFYIQYAYARIHSVIDNAKEQIGFTEDMINNADLSLLIALEEVNLLKSILKLPRFVESALLNNDPHKIYLYLMEVSTAFHSLWNSGKEKNNLRFIILDNEKLTISRLSLLKAVAICIKNMLEILGVNIKEKM